MENQTGIRFPPTSYLYGNCDQGCQFKAKLMLVVRCCFVFCGKWSETAATNLSYEAQSPVEGDFLLINLEQIEHIFSVINIEKLAKFYMYIAHICSCRARLQINMQHG